MSSGTIVENDSEIALPSRSVAPSGSSSTLRVWPAVVVVLLFWAFLFATRLVEISMFARFMSRLGAYAVLLLFSLGWWLSRRAVPWRDRLLAIAVVFLCGIVTWKVADKSLNAFGLFMAAFPVVATAWVAWLVVAKHLPTVVQRIGFCVAMFAAFGYFALLRFDGLEATQRSETSWRWQPTKEQIFLAAHENAERGTNESETTDAEPWSPQPGDILEYRGAHRDGVITNLRLAKDWTEHPPKLLWRQKAGPSWSTMIVVDGHLVTQEQRGEAEVVVCLDTATGKEIWVHEDAVRFDESLSGAGPRGTPTFADGRIYALGGKGNLNCLEATSGEVMWSHDIVADGGVKPADMPVWGYSNSPLVVDELVVVFAGGGDKSILAYRAESGELAWSCAGGKQSYSSPQLVELAGQKQIVMHDNAALRGLNPANGEQLWELPGGSETALPMLQPHQVETSDKLAVSMEPGAALLNIKRENEKWAVTPEWETNRFRPGFNDFVIHKGHLYGLDDGILCAFDLASGERLWKKGRLGHGQILVLADQDLLVVSTNRGAIALVVASPKGYEELGRFEAIEGKTWNGPVIDAKGRIFLRNGEEIAAYEVGTEQALVQPEAGGN